MAYLVRDSRTGSGLLIQIVFLKLVSSYQMAWRAAVLQTFEEETGKREIHDGQKRRNRNTVVHGGLD
jgi:hypothetical protein